jgi:hypothetical protein
MTQEDKEWISESIKSGNKYGFPICCIDEFILKPPSIMKNSKPTKDDLLRFEMAKINDNFTGLVPCLKHAKMIKEGKIILAELINYDQREEYMPFPYGRSFK